MCFLTVTEKMISCDLTRLKHTTSQNPLRLCTSRVLFPLQGGIGEGRFSLLCAWPDGVFVSLLCRTQRESSRMPLSLISHTPRVHSAASFHRPRCETKTCVRPPLLPFCRWSCLTRVCKDDSGSPIVIAVVGENQLLCLAFVRGHFMFAAPLPLQQCTPTHTKHSTTRSSLSTVC